MSRIPDSVRAMVLKRDAYACVVCGHSIVNRPGSIHHRRPRGSGGSKAADTNTSVNLITLCGTGTSGCHYLIESHRTEAFDSGWLVHAWDDPASVPVATQEGVVYLTADGSYQSVLKRSQA